MLPYYVYVLLSQRDQHLYIGFTSDIERRLNQHRRGLVQSTRNRRPLKLIFYEGYESKQDAIRREKYFKTTKGKRALKLMLRSTLNK